MCCSERTERIWEMSTLNIFPKCVSFSKILIQYLLGCENILEKENKIKTVRHNRKVIKRRHFLFSCSPPTHDTGFTPSFAFPHKWQNLAKVLKWDESKANLSSSSINSNSSFLWLIYINTFPDNRSSLEKVEYLFY